VLIDTSPIGILPDASVLARLVGGVIFVIRAGATPSAVVERAMSDIGPDTILGVVLNSVEERRIRTASYYNHYQSAPAKR
jgi:Mrp family chromosome partitioning ATPase